MNDKIDELGRGIQSALVTEGKDGRTIHLQTGSNQLLFTRYQQEPFTLPVGTQKTFASGNVVELLDNGGLRYTNPSGYSKQANVPAGASVDKWWCGLCANNRCGFANHKIM